MPGPPTRASGSSGSPRRWPGSATPVASSPRPRCRWSSSSQPPTTNEPIPMPGPPDGWRPASRPTASADATSPRHCSARSAPPKVRPRSAGPPWRAPSSDTSPGSAVTSPRPPRSTRPRAPRTCGSATPGAPRGPATTSPCSRSTRTGIDEAEQLLTESLELFDSHRLRLGGRGLRLPARLGGRTPGERGDVDRAAALLARALRLHDEVGDRRGIAQSLEGMAEVASTRCRGHGRATRRCGCRRRERAAALATETEARHLADLDQRLDRMLGALRRPARAARGPHDVTRRRRRPRDGLAAVPTTPTAPSSY